MAIQKGGVALDKKEWRSEYLARRSQLAPEEATRASAKICRSIASAPWFAATKRLLMYMPFRREVDIRPLMEAAWEQGKTVCLPKSDPLTKTITVYEIQALSELRPGAYGILEPDVNVAREGNIGELDIVFVPGVVFDRDGYRIGYGGGYYDRFLPKLTPKTLCVGVAFSLQVVASVPRDAFDRRLHGLVTETETLWFHA